jgi:hypothetical protein
MNRRSFFNFLDSAVIGTVIALKLPDSIAPLNNLIKQPKITFSAVMEAYNDCREKYGEPRMILLKKKTYTEFLELAKPELKSTKEQTDKAEGEYLRFRNAVVLPTDDSSVGETELRLIPTKHFHAKRYEYV